MSESETIGKATYDELMKLRLLTERSGILHDAQVLQLKYWPYVVFAIKEHQILLDDRKRILTFDLTFSKGVPKDFEQRAEALQNWVWDLLGPQFCIRLRNARNGKELLHGERKDPEWTPPPAAYDEVRDILEDESDEPV